MQVDENRLGRSQVISCRCTLLEAHLIRALAAKEESTVSDLLRAIALNRAQAALGVVVGQEDCAGSAERPRDTANGA